VVQKILLRITFRKVKDAPPSTEIDTEADLIVLYIDGISGISGFLFLGKSRRAEQDPQQQGESCGKRDG
jgi:hypothetical protein